MHRFIYRARWFALLAFFAVGCDGQEGEPLAPVLDEQVSPLRTPTPGQSSAFVPEGMSYGHVAWRPVGPRTVEFTVLSAFRRIYPGTGPDGLAVTGDLFEESETQARLCFGYLDDDCLSPLTYEVIDYNAEEGWLLCRAVTPPGPQPLPGTGVTVMETEPNASIDTANVMNLGDDYTSDLSFLLDEDYVGFTLTEQTQIGIHTVLEGLPDAWVTLLSSSGEELAYNHGEGWPPRPQDIQITLEAGTYYLRLRGHDYASGRAILELRELGTRPASPITHTYSGAGTYQASLEGCCARSQFNNHYTVSTQIRFDLPNSSPVSTLQPIIDAPINTPDFSFHIPATDAEGDQLTFRLASPAESGIEDLPTGLTVSSSGLVSWNTTWVTPDEQWSVQVVIEERRDGQLIGSSAVQFLLRPVPANHPPVCVLPPQTAFDVGLGEDLVFSIGGSDPDLDSWVDLNAVDLPDNAYASPYVPFWGPSGSSIDIHWTTPFIDSWVGRTFTLNFTVTDWENPATPCSVDIHIVPSRLPEANAGPDLTVLEGASVMLDGRGSSDPAGENLSYSWQVLEPHPGATLSSPSSPTPLFTPSDDGTYTVRLGVKNSHGTWVYDTVTVTVENVAPVAVAQGASIAPGTPFIASGSILDPGQDEWTVNVDFGDGSGVWVVGVERRSFILDHVYADSGIYTVVISVTDDEGAVRETSVQVQVDPRYMVPMVNLSGDAFLMEGELYTASGSFFDLDSSSWTATVDYGDGSGEQPLALDGQSFTLSHVYADSGYYPIFIRVTDDGGATGLSLSVVLVINRAPEVIATAEPTVEGSTTVITGSFTDPGMDTWEAWANFGEGWEPVHLNSDKSFTVTHRYPYAGTFWGVALYVLDDDGDAGDIWIPVVVTNLQPVVEISTIGTAQEGAEWFGAGSYTTGADRGDIYSYATVDYGDGSDVGYLWTAWNNQFWLSHRYENDGVYTVTVTFVAEDGITTGTATAQVVVHNAAPQISLLPWSPRMEEAENYAASAWGIIMDSPGEAVTLTIDYGDGSAVEQQTRSCDYYGITDFNLSHVYANSGTYTVTLTATDDDGVTSTFTLPAHIWNVMPQVIMDGYPWSSTEGAAYTTSGWFYDQGAEESFTVMADYGDGSGLQPVALNGTSFELSHVYADEGVYLVNVYVTDGDGGMGMATIWVQIDNVEPVVNWIEGEIDEGSTFTFSGSFTDPGADTWTATVDYGDGSGEQALALDGQTFQLSHTYANGSGLSTSGSVWVRDGDGYGGMSWIYLLVRNVAPVVHAEGGTINAGSVFTSSVSITDPGAEEMWAAFIDYGDGTSEWLGVDRTFQLSHFYETSGTYSVTIQVYDDADMGTITVPVVVRTPPPAVSLQGMSTHEGEALSLQGSFVSQASAWTGMVDYGDGSGEQPLALDGTTFTLGHVYADNGSYTVTVRIQDGEGGGGTATAQVVAENVAPVVTTSHDAPQYWGLPVHFAGTVIDPGVADTAAGLTTSWALGDGATASGLTTTHTYANPGSYVAVLTADDKDGGSGAASTALQIQKRPSSLTCGNASAVFGFPVTLSAQLADALPGSQLGGRRLTFRVGTATDLGSATTSGMGLGSVQSPGTLAPGQYTVTASFAEDSHYTAAQAHCTLTVSGSSGKITGEVRLANGAEAEFNVKVKDQGQLKGELKFENRSVEFEARSMTALGLSTDRRSGWFAGTGRDGRSFVAYVEDNRESGTRDVFKLWIDGVLQTGDGQLTRGNIKIHRETLAMAP